MSTTPQHVDLTFKLRRDDVFDWVQKNPILAEGEPGLELDTGRVKYGDGVKTWLQLDYSVPDAVIQNIVNAAIAAAGGFPGGEDPGDDGTSFLLLYENAKV